MDKVQKPSDWFINCLVNQILNPMKRGWYMPRNKAADLNKPCNNTRYLN
jgi:hypothetical protein